MHGRGHFKRDGARAHMLTAASRKTEEGARLVQARVDLGSILDYASSFGTVAISRAYADWSVPVNADYKDQLVGRAVELVQMFPTVQSMKNGADIRMSVDVVEDLFRLPELTHVVIVSGDSDFIALAQRCRRLGRYVVGIGVAGGTSKALNAACNEYKDYDGLPGLEGLPEPDGLTEPGGMDGTRSTQSDGSGAGSVLDDAGGASDSAGTAGSPQKKTITKATKPAAKKVDTKAAGAVAVTVAGPAKSADQKAATRLLRRALELGQSKNDVDWVASSGVKTQMLRMDPTFQEKLLGYKTFTDFLKSRNNIIEIREEGQVRLVRLRGPKESGI